MSRTDGRTSTSYADFWSDDDQPRIRRLTDVTDPANPTASYHVKLPCGHVGHLTEHLVDEHDDGTFSIVSQPNPPGVAMNSLLCHIEGCGWHGYLHHNIFEQIP